MYGGSLTLITAVDSFGRVRPTLRLRVITVGFTARLSVIGALVATKNSLGNGQDRPVQVHRLIAEGTLEDRIAALLETKRELANAVIGSGEGWIAQLSDAELAELVSLRAAS